MSTLKSVSTITGFGNQLRAQSEYPPKELNSSHGTNAKPLMQRWKSSNGGGNLPSEVSVLRTALREGVEKKLEPVTEFPIPPYADFVKGKQLQNAGVHVLIDSRSPGLRSHLSKEAIQV